MKFYSSQRLDIRRIETLKEGTEAVGNRVRVKVVKNKVAAPFRLAEFDIEYGTGISSEGCLLDLALEHDLVQKSGSFFSYGELRLGQGRNNTKQYLAENPETAREIEAKLVEALGIELQGASRRADPRSRRRDADRRRRRRGRGRRAQGSLARAVAGTSAATPSRPRSRRCGERSGRPPRCSPGSAAAATAPTEIEAAIARLTEIGELDDERFACRYAEDKRELRGWGPERIREALGSRAGSRQPLVEMALEADSQRAQVRGRASCSPGAAGPWMRRRPIGRGRSAT